MRTITVKGIGNVSAKPDLVVITMGLESLEKDYERAMQGASKKIKELNESLESVGFEKSSVKTTSFNVDARYESQKDGAGNYTRVFKGFSCSQRLKIEFDLDMKLLALALNAIAGCVAKPELSIRFQVKDPTAISEELLKSATLNAKEKAKILCEALGVQLGDLLSVDYNWGELRIFSRTEFMMAEKCMALPTGASFDDMDFEPDDVDLSDTVTFVWEIK